MIIPNIDNMKAGGGDEAVKMVDASEKAKHKEYTYKRRRARHQEIHTGDHVLVKQNKPLLGHHGIPCQIMVWRSKN